MCTGGHEDSDDNCVHVFVFQDGDYEPVESLPYFHSCLSKEEAVDKLMLGMLFWMIMTLKGVLDLFLQSACFITRSLKHVPPHWPGG